MSFQPRDYIRHILVEADYLVQQSGRLTFESFVVDETMQRALVRGLEVIGEAARNIPEDFGVRYPEVECRRPWPARANRLIHGYFGAAILEF